MDRCLPRCRSPRGKKDNEGEDVVCRLRAPRRRAGLPRKRRAGRWTSTSCQSGRSNPPNWKLLKKLLQLTSRNTKKYYEGKLRRGFNELFVKDSRVVLAPAAWSANIQALMSTYEEAKAAAATKKREQRATKKRK
jgi:hypothetical protein